VTGGEETLLAVLDVASKEALVDAHPLSERDPDGQLPRGRHLSASESDEPPKWIVGRYTHGHPISRNHLDVETAHAAAELREHLVASIALHAVQPTAVNGHYRAWHVDEIIFAQFLVILSILMPAAPSPHRGCRRQPARSVNAAFKFPSRRLLADSSGESSTISGCHFRSWVSIRIFKRA
jgi:hypothetical protein